MKPTIEQIEKDGKLVWRIGAAGVVRYHEQEWQAQWLYSYLMRLYNCDEINPQQLSHGPSEHELDDTSARSN
jgi:hypothetical protein